MFGAYIEGVDDRYELINKDIDRFIQQEGGRADEDYDVLHLYQESSLEKLKDLPLELRHRIAYIYIHGSGIVSIPDLTCLPFLGAFSAMNIQSLKSIEGLRNTSVMSVAIRGTSVTDISVLSTCKNLTNVYAENTGITTLPDFSDLSKGYEEKRVEHLPGFTWLELRFDNSELNNIEMVKTIGKNFLLSVRGCNRLNNLDALLESNIVDLIIDEQNYQRLKPWFDKNLPLIKARKADFTFGFVELE
jgi:hypothetical protein